MKKSLFLLFGLMLFLQGCLEIVPEPKSKDIEFGLDRQDMFLDGSKLYVGVGNLGFDIIDVGDSRNPRLLKNYTTKGYTYALAFRDKKLFLAEGKEGLHIVDVSDSNFIKELSAFDTGDANATALALSSDGKRVVIGTHGGIQLVDIQNVKSPKYLGRYDSNGTIRDIAFMKNPNLVLLANADFGLEIVDIKTPSHPIRVGEIALEGTPIKLKQAINLDYFYVATLNSTLKYINLTDTNRPQIVALYDDHDGSIIYDVDIDNINKKLYLAKGNRGFTVADISQNHYSTTTQFDTNGTSRGITFLRGTNRVYVADGNEGLKIFDISDLSDVQRISVLKF